MKEKIKQTTTRKKKEKQTTKVRNGE